ncbi:MAG TPA: DUF6174 domain-containing protein, partial [Longimicrobiaceae bacterium]|nr:DUF6174 domain-containing protein [Longimicrobiaceae bacterium]
MSIRSIRRILALAAVVALSACDGLTMTDGAPVAERLHQWRAQNLTDYRYDFQRTCYCSLTARQAVTIEVHGGKVTSVTARGGAAWAEGDPHVTWPTVEDLFKQIDDARAAGISPLVVRWDAGRGYPTYIEMGTLANDAGTVMNVGNLQPL